MSRLTVYHDAEPRQPLKVISDGEHIAATLAEVGVRFERWQASAPVAPGATQEEVIAAYRPQIDRLIAERGYQTVDVISMHPEHPQKDALRAKFLEEHRHREDEVRFFVAGHGLFTLHIDDCVYAVLCEKDDLISVPAGTPHWFDMSESPSFVAIRLFDNAEGWVAHFTGVDIAQRFPRLELDA